jgi:predicted membrane-bound spermidine synthase
MRAPFDIEFLMKALVGTASPVLGVITSFQEQLEWHMRIASLVIGMLVGVLSLIGMWRKLRKR